MWALLLVLVSGVTLGSGLQTEPEEVTLTGVVDFFTNDFVIKKFYVQITLQVFACNILKG